MRTLRLGGAAASSLPGTPAQTHRCVQNPMPKFHPMSCTFEQPESLLATFVGNPSLPFDQVDALPPNSNFTRFCCSLRPWACSSQCICCSSTAPARERHAANFVYCRSIAHLLSLQENDSRVRRTAAASCPPTAGRWSSTGATSTAQAWASASGAPPAPTRRPTRAASTNTCASTTAPRTSSAVSRESSEVWVQHVWAFYVARRRRTGFN